MFICRCCLHSHFLLVLLPSPYFPPFSQPEGRDHSEPLTVSRVWPQRLWLWKVFTERAFPFVSPFLLLRCQVSAGTSVSSSQALCVHKWVPGSDALAVVVQQSWGAWEPAGGCLEEICLCHANNVIAKSLTSPSNCFYLILWTQFGICGASIITLIWQMRILSLKLA